MGYLLLTLLPALLLCCRSIDTLPRQPRTETVARNVVLSDQPMVIEPEKPWGVKGSDLQLCLEPPPEYRRSLGPREVPGQFLDQTGNAIQIILTLRSGARHELSLSPTQFYLSRNLACFSLGPRIEGYDRVELQSIPPMRIDHVYWYWYFFH